MRFKTSRLQLEVLNPHKDQLLIFYILLNSSFTTAMETVFNILKMEMPTVLNLFPKTDTYTDDLWELILGPL